MSAFLPSELALPEKYRTNNITNTSNQTYYVTNLGWDRKRNNFCKTYSPEERKALTQRIFSLKGKLLHELLDVVMKEDPQKVKEQDDEDGNMAFSFDLSQLTNSAVKEIELLLNICELQIPTLFGGIFDSEISDWESLNRPSYSPCPASQQRCIPCPVPQQQQREFLLPPHQEKTTKRPTKMKNKLKKTRKVRGTLQDPTCIPPHETIYVSGIPIYVVAAVDSPTHKRQLICTKW